MTTTAIKQVKKEEKALTVADESNQVQELTMERTPPCNYGAEKALLGALLHNNNTFETVSETLVPEHFADAVHGRIFAAIKRLIEKGHIADPITLKDYFDQDEALEDVGGAGYLIQLADSVVSIINVRSYALTIRDLYYRRQLISFGEDVVNDAHAQDLENDAVMQLEIAEQRLFDLSTVGSLDKGFMPFGHALTQAIDRAEVAYRRDSHIVGVTTGFRDLDTMLGGLHPSDLLVIAGRPSMGKTAFATNIAFNAARSAMNSSEGAHVAFFSLEMSSEQLATRLLAQEAAVSSDRIRRGAIEESDFPKFIEISRELSELPLYIDDTPALSISAVRTRARRLMRQKGLGLIVIDYLQLLQASTGTRPENRVQEVSEITRGLKALAKELNVPVLALSQLSRAVEQREDKRPQLSDLRESGTIEQDADVVMFIYREEYYEARKQPEPGTDKYIEWSARMDKIRYITEIIIGKQRHGPIGKVQLLFDNALTKYVDLARDHDYDASS